MTAGRPPEATGRSRSVLLEAPHRMRLVTGEIPRPGHGEALVRVSAAGICGSDRELYEGTRPEGFRTYPIVPGHEWSGIVSATGPGVDPSLAGAPVVGEGYRNCQACDRCREGDTNLCTTGYDETGFTRPGAFADHLVLPARLLHPLPPGTDLRSAALLEPAAVAVAAVLRASVQPGERVAVVGGGTLGLLAVQVLATYSPAELLVVEPRAGRAGLARESRATGLSTPDEAAALAPSFDAVVETAGVQGSARAAAQMLRRGGRLVLAGIPGGTPEGLPPSLIVERQLAIGSVFGMPSAAWVQAVRMFRAGLLRPGLLISHELELEDFDKALRLVAGTHDADGAEVGKVLLCPRSV
ncbi:alcohol dehydrogenase catalytic domain-containing protein [Actinomadura barringtoniae]|uniref:Alcohol dehydrogenase catalytic domain-containing protein n=1 Tax=Actinomadura barringtoniae TaxID=1427535 RepID=A0A939T623_9ACTN|nr:alcohol dehydrogenase catalytic domain-containing protein [Actinomadura barringtoniae]MBO2447772.1 alcohol dehydrogenase catalytic domain-containing protein [Actinomadura barringtoniae]